MTTSILVAYATKKGSTREVAETIAVALGDHGLEAETVPAAEVADLDPYDAVVLGSALYTGRLHRDARNFLHGHAETLARLPVAVFAMGPRSLAEADVAESRKQLGRELAKVPEVEPVSVAIFGGVLDPAQHHFPFNRMPATDARDWEAIRAWADELSAALPVRPAGPPVGAAASSR